MAQLTISEAIRQSPIGRTKFYSKYIDNGLISVSVDVEGKKYIDSSELVRVFGSSLTTEDNKQSETIQTPEKQHTSNESVQPQPEVIKVLREQIADLKADKEYQREQIANLTARLEPPATVKRNNIIKQWWYGLDK